MMRSHLRLVARALKKLHDGAVEGEELDFALAVERIAEDLSEALPCEESTEFLSIYYHG